MADDRVVHVSAPRRLGVEPADARLRIASEVAAGVDGVGRRLLFLDDEPAFELSFWCGTCPLLFERLPGADKRLSVEDLSNRLASVGLAEVDLAVVETYAALLEEAEYLPVLLSVQPRLVQPGAPDDYFSGEQVAAWGMNGFWGLPENPHVPYYRTHQATAGPGRELFEFVIPMVPPTWNDSGRVRSYETAMAGGSVPTAVALGILDICEPGWDAPCDGLHATHWGLMHFLLDGHHKFEAAARLGAAVQLLTLIRIDAGIGSTLEDIRTALSTL